MAVEKMELLNLVGHLEDYDQLIREIILSEKIQLINAYDQINKSKFNVSVSMEHISEIVELTDISTYERHQNISDLSKKIDDIISKSDYDLSIDYSLLKNPYDFSDVIEEINRLYDKFIHLNTMIDQLKEEVEYIETLKGLRALENIDVDFEQLLNLDAFEVQIGILTDKNYKRLKKNYENVTAIVLPVGKDEAEQYVYIVVAPRDLHKETERILKSVYFDPIEVKEDYLGTPKEIIKKIDTRKEMLKKQLSSYNEEVKVFKSKHLETIKECYSKLKMQEKIIEVSQNIASTEQFFYLAAWVSEGNKDVVERLIDNSTKNVIVNYKTTEGRSLNPPTKLKNNWISKPFENLVQMYGVPNYNELDPTVLFSIVYMLLFGAMFGDLGQGLVFWAIGYYLLKNKNQKLFGGILTRLGISSMIFGFFYDSFFGYEHLISRFIPLSIYIRPIENINTMLSTAIGLGIVLLLISFIYSIINKLKNKSFQEGILGRNGVNGLVLYIALLSMVAFQFIQGATIITQLLTGIILISVILLVIKEPLANKIRGHSNLYHSSKGEYYVESGFDVIETFLSLFSNTMSFIRVGAFALNHVGLFIAFHTMARLIGSTFGNLSMFFIGNLIVICLEGLIVFIQGLRLVYYEMFSKYYNGNGYLFEPTRLE